MIQLKNVPLSKSEMTGGVIFTSLVILDYEELCAVDNIVITGKKKITYRNNS